MKKAELWDLWISRTLLQDIKSDETPDPVSLFEIEDGDIETSSELSSYKWGMNDGDYLYFIYQLDDPCSKPRDITPVYIGESSDISSRIGQHSRKIRNSFPVAEWEDDGEWGSFSKYDHIATVYDRSDRPLYVWIIDVDEIDHCPYGFETYRQELEAKLVGLVHDQDQYRRICANREFVPNRILHEIGHAGPDWVPEEPDAVVDMDSDEQVLQFDNQFESASKADRWYEWLSDYLIADIHDENTADPIPLFETTEDLEVKSEDGVLNRSETIDGRIRREGKRCIDENGVPESDCDGLLYMMYQLEKPVDELTAKRVIPRYIGKAEVYGKKKQLSSNFTEIARDRNSTNSFARWGDGNYWHVGELSNTLNGDDKKKLHWVEALFEPESRTLSQQTYLWVHAWNREEDAGPYGTPATLAEVEALLIGTAYDAYPDQLLNKSGTPDHAPIKSESVDPSSV
ncbi:hypothetical protein C482_08848 [Natrialba chahannaoensis JCM 10990]|uniref:GIY-YIG domain-containing protein n=1 Tax=Natrialba chahannaoensis JCM 10990 TaxID=1227492 RepID=M0APP0_9EURY|nr:hypothetical protein [Natrialba chahannaoensis]ELZ00297.1 hypothetical protein C482_08848 [Natrialba chahannaoensis JCM 10990]